MKGLELSRLFYETYGVPMIEQEFSRYKDRIAAGRVGHGSECFGFDDEISKDHDFEPGFSIWLTDEDEREFGFKLMRAYKKLPKEFMGQKLQNESVFGPEFLGVHTVSEFYSFYLPNGEIPTSLEAWLSIPDHYLAEAVNGEIFTDPVGEFSRIRREIMNCPEDVRLQKLASAVFYMAQSGQYNYSRCLNHGEKAAAAVALTKFAESTAQAVFLLNREYMPYYKWAYRKMSTLTTLGKVSDMLCEILAFPYEQEKNLPIIEEISKLIAGEIRNQELSQRQEAYLEPYAYCIKSKIKDGSLRNSPIML